MADKPLCAIPSCGNASFKRGWCDAHYKRWWRHGDPLAGGVFRGPDGDTTKFIEAAISTTDKVNCINWPYARNAQGAAQVRIKRKTTQVSRIVCERRHGPPPTERHQAAHSCGKSHDGCINPWHLRWATQTENEADKLIHGTRQHGEQNKFAKLTSEQVLQIRRHLSKGQSLSGIGRTYGVSAACIKSIQDKRSWAWLEG